MAKKRKTELDIDIIPEEEKAKEVKKEEEGVEEEAVREPASKKKLIIIISSAVAAILLAVIIFISVPSKKAVKKEEPSKKPPVAEVPPIPLYQLEPFLIPLKANKPDGKFLKVSMSVELSDKDLAREFERNIVFLRENIIFILKKRELEDFQDKMEKERLIKDIISALNMGLQSGTVINLYFTEFLIL